MKSVFFILILLITNIWIYPDNINVITEKKMDRMYLLVNRPIIVARTLPERQYLSINNILLEINYDVVGRILKKGIDYKIEPGSRDDNIFAIRPIYVGGEIVGIVEYGGHLGAVPFGAISDPLGEIIYNLGPSFKTVTDNNRFCVKKHTRKNYYIVAGYLKNYPDAYFIANLSKKIWDKDF